MLPFGRFISQLIRHHEAMFGIADHRRWGTLKALKPALRLLQHRAGAAKGKELLWTRGADTGQRRLPTPPDNKTGINIRHVGRQESRDATGTRVSRHPEYVCTGPNKGTIAGCAEGARPSTAHRRKDLESRQGVTLQRAWPMARAINRNLRALTKPEEPGNPTGIWGRSWRLRRSPSTEMRALTATETLLERTQRSTTISPQRSPRRSSACPRPRRPT